MPNASDIAWFKEQFSAEILPQLAGTPFDLDMFAALACQETGEVWPLIRKNLSHDRVLELCVGDTIDGRTAFPRSRAELEAKPRGKEMFAIAHAALVDMAKYISGYASVAQKPDKFCHGYGMFQYDIQFFTVDPDYFLERRYATFAGTFGKCLDELRDCLRKLGWSTRQTLTDLEKAAVAITYNKGSYKPSAGLKQGYFDGHRYYGENFYDYLRLAHTVATPGGTPQTLTPPAPGTAIVSPPLPATSKGDSYEVDVTTILRVRSAPEIDPKAPGKNVVANLPDGQPVTAVSATVTNGFLEIETTLRGALIHGFASKDFLKRVADAPLPAPPVPAPAPPTSGIVAVELPHRPGSITRRTDPAGAYSLNEPGQPGRTGTTAADLRGELGAIIGWLGVDTPANKRYQPRPGVTFCNIYAHDYCGLAGVYLPRVWWTGAAIEQLSQGRTVEPRYGETVDEQRANDLFRWLRDFGLRFGWRRAATLTELQTAANAGAIGIIVARRTEDGRSGHIVAVVPETNDHVARRNAAGDVVAPLQSQAGAVNFRYGTSTTDWWKGAQFAESAFWIHA